MPPLRRMGRPGLIGTMARTAVITGTANATSRAMNRRAASREQQQYESQQYQAQQQQQAYAQQQAQQPSYPQEQVQAADAPAGDDLIAKLTQLGDLKAAGVLSEAEFAAAKAKLLA